MVERKLQPNPLVKSTNGSATRPSRIRFVNNFLYPIDLFWLDFDGKEKYYTTIPVSGQFPQATYTTHAWRIRETGSKRLLGTYVGEEATIEMTKAAACLVHKGFILGYRLSKKELPAEWGQFKRRGEAKGIPIRAFDCVCDKAVTRAEHIVEKMLEHVSPPILKRLQQNSADIAIIGKDQVTCDMPMHTFMRGGKIPQQEHAPPRDWDGGARGCGGSWTVPTCSAGEENLTMVDDRNYPNESILVHEFAHSVMSVGMSEDQRQAVMGSYFNARANQLYRKDCYMMDSADEYWAEGTQTWFEATIRTDVNDKINKRAQLKEHDPGLASLLELTYGDGDWRYQKTSPIPLSHHPTPRMPPPVLTKDNLLKMHRKAARYTTCCLPYPIAKWVSGFGMCSEGVAPGKLT